jgi:hypothetical protein
MEGSRVLLNGGDVRRSANPASRARGELGRRAWSHVLVHPWPPFQMLSLLRMWRSWVPVLALRPRMRTVPRQCQVVRGQLGSLELGIDEQLLREHL